jgi:DNA polymerase III delta prime subunit
MTERLWVEKYRPRSLEDVVMDEDTLTIFRSYVEKKNIPHLLFCGSAGLGKTTCAKILSRAITDESDIMYINASDETSVETIRGKVKSFCSTMSFSDIKIVILDEFDGMTRNAMDMLRFTMEEFSDSCRFILTCNHSERVIDPIKSRCQSFDFSGTEKNLISKKGGDILKAENISYKENIEDIKNIIKRFYPDIRKIINTLQQFSTSGTFNYIENQSAALESKKLLIKYIKERDIKAIVRDILGSGVDYKELFNTVYDGAEDLSGGSSDKKINIMLLVAERMRAHSSCIDPEMNFKDLCLCVARILI